MAKKALYDHTFLIHCHMICTFAMVKEAKLVMYFYIILFNLIFIHTNLQMFRDSGNKHNSVLKDV